MSFYRFPSDFVFWIQLDEEIHKNIKSIVMPKIKQDEPDITHKRGFKTSYHEHQDYRFKKNKFLLDNEYLVNNIVWNPLDLMFSKHNENNEQVKMDFYEKSMISEGWFNIYNKGDTCYPHDHFKRFPYTHNNELYFSSFAVVYILEDKNDKSSLEFSRFDPTSYMNDDHIIFNTADEKTIKEGTVLIFPANLTHAVNAVEVDGRVTIAYNIDSKFSRYKTHST